MLKLPQGRRQTSKEGQAEKGPGTQPGVQSSRQGVVLQRNALGCSAQSWGRAGRAGQSPGGAAGQARGAGSLRPGRHKAWGVQYLQPGARRDGRQARLAASLPRDCEVWVHAWGRTRPTPPHACPLAAAGGARSTEPQPQSASSCGDPSVLSTDQTSRSLPGSA